VRSIRFYEGYMRNMTSPAPAAKTARMKLCCTLTPAADVGASDPETLDEAVGLGVTLVPVFVPLAEEV
jgi:hypothetical protein